MPAGVAARGFPGRAVGTILAAALFGDPDVDLQYHCMKAISQKPAQE